jgi:hypothetical protein
MYSTKQFFARTPEKIERPTMAANVMKGIVSEARL